MLKNKTKQNAIQIPTSYNPEATAVDAQVHFLPSSRRRVSSFVRSLGYTVRAIVSPRFTLDYIINTFPYHESFHKHF